MDNKCIKYNDLGKHWRINRNRGLAITTDEAKRNLHLEGMLSRQLKSRCRSRAIRSGKQINGLWYY